MKEKQYKLLSRGVGPDGSVSGEYGGMCHSTVYSRRLGPYLHEVAEGGVVVDKWNVPFEVGYNLVVNGPMVNVDLPEGTIDKFGTKIPGVMMLGLEGSFKTLAAMKVADPKWSGFDYVSLDLYLDLWARAGARIGVRRGNEIQWRDGSVSVIPPEEKRWLPLHEVDACTEPPPEPEPEPDRQTSLF